MAVTTLVVDVVRISIKDLLVVGIRDHTMVVLDLENQNFNFMFNFLDIFSNSYTQTLLTSIGKPKNNFKYSDREKLLSLKQTLLQKNYLRPLSRRFITYLPIGLLAYPEVPRVKCFCGNFLNPFIMPSLQCNQAREVPTCSSIHNNDKNAINLIQKVIFINEEVKQKKRSK